MIRIAQSAKRFSAAAATTVLAATAITMAAVPASADSDDIDVTKTADMASAAAGDTVNYTVEVRGSDLIDLADPGATSDTNVNIFDDLPNHMSFVPGSGSVTFNEVSFGAALHLLPNSYAGGSGWTGPWVETNDDGLESSGDIQSGALALRMRNPSGPLPELARTVDPTGTVRSVAFSFVSADFATGANDQVIAEMSVDGGTTWPYSETITGGNGLDAHTITATGVSADTIKVRFRVLTTGTWGIVQTMLFSGISVAYAYDTASSTTNYLADELLDVDGNINIGFWDVSYAETVILTYQAKVDDIIADTTTSITNYVTITSDDDAVGETASYQLLLNRAPDFDIAVTNNGPLHIGEALTLTVHVKHSDASDGYPLCDADFESNTPPNYGFNYVSGDTDLDGCIDYGEEWVFTKTFTDRTTTVGTFSLELGLFGDGVGEGDPDISVFAEDEYTVVLAETGAPDESATGTVAVGLVLLGSAMVAYSRRKFV